MPVRSIKICAERLICQGRQNTGQLLGKRLGVGGGRGGGGEGEGGGGGGRRKGSGKVGVGMH